MRVDYRGHWPDDLRRVAERSLGAALSLGLVPPWVTEMRVRYEGGDSPDSADVVVDVTYLRATLTLRPGFFEYPERDREDTLLHEFFHVHTGPLMVLAEDMAAEIEKTNEALGERYGREARRANERVAVSLETAMSGWLERVRASRQQTAD